ncbi:MAG TPA: hypothetical protein EYH17_05120 [Pyrodictium sp.]|nr:hypothetical protein [Pyrodictium sp.]
MLAKSGVLRVIAILFEHGSMPIHRIPRYGVGVGTVYKSAREATMLGLVKPYNCGNSICLELTEKGRKIGEVLQKLLDVLEEALGGMRIA